MRVDRRNLASIKKIRWWALEDFNLRPPLRQRVLHLSQRILLSPLSLRSLIRSEDLCLSCLSKELGWTESRTGVLTQCLPLGRRCEPQQIERWAAEPKALGSSPSGPAISTVC